MARKTILIKLKSGEELEVTGVRFHPMGNSPELDIQARNILLAQLHHAVVAGTVTEARVVVNP